MSLKFVLGTAAKDHQASLLENMQQEMNFIKKDMHHLSHL